MRVPRSWILCGLAGLLVASLLVAGTRRQEIRTYALDAPNEAPVAQLQPSSQVCEGPLTSAGPAAGAAIWGNSLGLGTKLTLDIEQAGGRTLATAELEPGNAETEWTARLSRTVGGGQPLVVCITDDRGAFSLFGSATVDNTVVMIGQGQGYQFSLVLLSPHNRSFFGSLSTAFSRASLWRPSWVGSWTFWLLAAGFLAAFGLGVAAVARAASADGDERGTENRAQESDPTPLSDEHVPTVSEVPPAGRT